MVLAEEVNVLEIMKRAKSGGEIVSWNESEDNVRKEVLRRNAKAGYCNRASGIRSMPATDKYRENYDKIDWSK